MEGFEGNTLTILSWNLELIAAKERQNFLERMEKEYNFDFILAQEWARECENLTKPNVGEFRVVTL